MVSGHLAVKKNRWYAILCLRHPDGRRYDKWIATGLSYPGNKRKAEAMLIELRRQHFNSHIWNAATLLSEYIPDWLKTRQKEISETTYSSYLQIANEIVRYFLNQDVRLSQISPHHIETYYQTLYERGLKSNSVLHHHALLHKALADASRKGLIAENPMEKVQRPAKGSYIPHPYTAEEMKTLFAALQGHYMEVPIKLAAYYGLRRSEVLGLRWQAIDFEQETISVEHILMNPPYGGHEDKSIQGFFPDDLASSETADLFMSVILYRLKKNGRAAVVVPDGFLFGLDNAKVNIKKKLIGEFNLHTVVRLPGSVFSPYTSITTNLLFFDNTKPTTETWFYRVDIPSDRKHFSKTKPMELKNFDDCIAWWNNREVMR